MDEATSQAEADPVLFDAVLLPHRSLGRAGFLIVMGAAALFSAGVSLLFSALGAWPVLGFFGLDLVLLYWAFKMSYRSARAAEMVRLTPERLVIDRIDPRGRRTTTELAPYWLSVELAAEEGPLRLVGQGRSVTVGAFLPPRQREALAADLRDALHRLRNPRFS